jgi:hypothetical protein
MGDEDGGPGVPPGWRRRGGLFYLGNRISDDGDRLFGRHDDGEAGGLVGDDRWFGKDEPADFSPPPTASHVGAWIGTESAAEELLRGASPRTPADTLLPIKSVTVIGASDPYAGVPLLMPGSEATDGPLFPDIAHDIVSMTESDFYELWAQHGLYFAESVRSLIRQPGWSAKAPDFDGDEAMLLDPGGIGRLVALFQGFEKEDTGVLQDEAIPVFDILLDDDYTVAFSEGAGGASSASFRVKLLGVGGGGGYSATWTLGSDCGPYDRSCQLHALVDIRWTTYVRKATGDRLHTLGVQPSGTTGLKAVPNNRAGYKNIARERDRKLRVVSEAGLEPTRLVWHVKRGHRSIYECPVSLAGLGLPAEMTVLVDSMSTARAEVTIRHSGSGGFIYGATGSTGEEAAVLLRAGP